MPNSSCPPTRKALRVALLYALAAAIWIAFTDSLAALLASHPGISLQFSLYMGWVFVAVTALLLFWVLRRDFQRQQQALTMAQEQERLLQRVLNTLPVGVWLLDEQGEILQSNAEGARILGGGDAGERDPVATFNEWWANAGERISAREWGTARVLSRGEGADNEEITIESLDGKRRDVLHSAVPWRDEQGRVRGVIVVNQDITALKQTQTSLVKTEAFLAKLLDNAPTPIYVTSADGQIRLVNQAWCRLLGLSPEHVIGRQVEQMYPAAVAAQYLENNRQVLEDKQVKVCEEHVDLPDGRHYYQSVKFPVFDPVEEGMAVAGISIDVTQHKQLEERLQTYHRQLRALASDLTLTEVRERRQISTALHDLIGQPLALACIRLGELGTKNRVEECRDVAGGVRSLIEEAIRHVRDLLFELSPSILYEFGLEAALKSLAERFSSQYALPVEFQDDGQPKPLSADLQVLLFQAARELLVNIVKHAQASRAQIVVSRAGERVRVSIEDNGRGFPAQGAQHDGYGLFSIRERLHHLGGEMEIATGSDCGTRIALHAPVTNGTEGGGR